MLHLPARSLYNNRSSCLPYPSASGRKVFGKFLKDGENTNFNRSDFLGVIKDECIPEWAAEKLAELEPPDEDESEGITMGGI